MSRVVMILVVLILVACKSEYDQLVNSEMEKEGRYEDLLFDFEFDQTRQKFYDQCWQMNKDSIISQGPKNQYAMHIIENGTLEDQKEKIEMLFYGIFDEEKIMHGMDIRYSYPSWSAWSEEFHSINLIPVLKKYYLQKFPGNDFITIPLKSVDANSYVKVDKNRQILIYPLDTKDVVVKIEDLAFKLSQITLNEE